MDLYGIIGTFTYDTPRDKRIGTLGQSGIFLYDPMSASIVHGVMNDPWGDSDIEGSMWIDLMQFNKNYRDGEDHVKYNFSKKGGLWIGRWEGKETKGSTECYIQLLKHDASEHMLTLPPKMLSKHR